MATTHITFNDQLPHGRQLRRALQQREEGAEGLVGLRRTMLTMIDGDGTNAVQFDLVTAKFGFSSNADAKAAFDDITTKLTAGNNEINSLARFR